MPNGAVHTLQYTALDDPATYTPPGSAAGFAHTYDAEQRLATSTLPDGRISTRGYDAADRPSTLQYPEATISYSYTANNTTDPISTLLRTPASIGTAETVSFGYDGSVVTGSSLSGAAVGQFTYGYDANLVLNAITLQSGSDSVSHSGGPRRGRPADRLRPAEPGAERPAGPAERRHRWQRDAY